VLRSLFFSLSIVPVALISSAPGDASLSIVVVYMSDSLFDERTVPSK